MRWLVLLIAACGSSAPLAPDAPTSFETAAFTLTADGEVLLDAAPSVGVIVRAGFLFDVPVRFAEDRLDINRATFAAGEAPSVPLVEIRE